jgi:hypothetical protein
LRCRQPASGWLSCRRRVASRPRWRVGRRGGGRPQGLACYFRAVTVPVDRVDRVVCLQMIQIARCSFCTFMFGQNAAALCRAEQTPSCPSAHGSLTFIAGANGKPQIAEWTRAVSPSAAKCQTAKMRSNAQHRGPAWLGRPGRLAFWTRHPSTPPPASFTQPKNGHHFDSPVMMRHNPGVPANHSRLGRQWISGRGKSHT